MTDNLENFHYNVIIANMHEMYSFLNKQIEKDINYETLINNYTKILIAINPIIPHYSNECLEMIRSKDEISWPTYENKYLEEKDINIVVQINGKKRALIEIEKDTIEQDIINLIMSNEKLFKYFQNKEIKKKIFIKNKVINFIL